MDRKSRMEKAEGDRWKSDENTVRDAERNTESERNAPDGTGAPAERPLDEERSRPARPGAGEDDVA